MEHGDNLAYPSPAELSNPEVYSRKGQIRNFDNYAETLDGDFVTLKAFKNDEAGEAIDVQNIQEHIHSLLPHQAAP